MMEPGDCAHHTVEAAARFMVVVPYYTPRSNKKCLDWTTYSLIFDVSNFYILKIDLVY